MKCMHALGSIRLRASDGVVKESLEMFPFEIDPENIPGVFSNNSFNHSLILLTSYRYTGSCYYYYYYYY